MRNPAVKILVFAATVCLAHQSNAQDRAYAALQVFTNGAGRISPFQAGQMLEVWGTYSMVAIPEPGFAFLSWESVDVLVKAAHLTNSTGEVSTKVETTVTSRNQFFTAAQLTFKMRPAFETVFEDGASLASMYGWRANFGSTREPVEPDVYRTAPNATAEERGDRVPNGSRTVPLAATLIFDYSATPPSLTTEISDAVLEGGEPFPLAVRSYYGRQLANSTWHFSGDYLQAMYPKGSQYEFDWEFSRALNGEIMWNGNAAWLGGHLWSLTISNVALLPQALLSITPEGAAKIRASWRTNFTDHVLEYAPALQTSGWKLVTNTVTTTTNRHSVILDIDTTQRFYRLRKI